jgi:hypothetical protein
MARLTSYYLARQANAALASNQPSVYNWIVVSIVIVVVVVAFFDSI